MNQEIISSLRSRYKDINNTVKQAVSPADSNAGLFAQSSYLRVDNVLVNGRGEYEFNPMELNTPRKEYEKRLNRNDLFVVTGWSLALTYEANARPGAGIMATSLADFKQKLAQVGSNLADAVTPDLEAIYNGFITLQTGTTQTFDGFPTHLLNVSNLAESTDHTLDSDPSKKIYYMPENIVLSGTKDQKFSLRFPSYSGAVYNPAATTSPDFTPDGVVGVSLFLQGFLVKSGAMYIEIDGSVNPFLYV